MSVLEAGQISKMSVSSFKSVDEIGLSLYSQKMSVYELYWLYERMLLEALVQVWRTVKDFSKTNEKIKCSYQRDWGVDVASM